MIELWVRGIGLIGPGLADWASAAPLLRAATPASYGGEAPAAPWARTATVVPLPSRLAANERRRAGMADKASLAAADQAVAMADADPAQLATVFTSSTGDPANCHALCEALATPERLLSPTRFTNSVHNTPAGYWHIATRSMRSSTSIAAFDASFGAGLLEAAVACHTSGAEVLLVACDIPYPAPLHALRSLSDTVAVALVLAPRSGPRRGAWRLRLHTQGGVAADGATGATTDVATGAATGAATDAGTGAALGGAFQDAVFATATPCADAGLEALRREVPAARALPLLCAMAAMADTRTAKPGVESGAAAALATTLQIEVAEGLFMAITVQAAA